MYTNNLNTEMLNKYNLIQSTIFLYRIKSIKYNLIILGINSIIHIYLTGST